MEGSLEQTSKAGVLESCKRTTFHHLQSSIQWVTHLFNIPWKIASNPNVTSAARTSPFWSWFVNSPGICSKCAHIFRRKVVFPDFSPCEVWNCITFILQAVPSFHFYYFHEPRTIRKLHFSPSAKKLETPGADGWHQRVRVRFLSLALQASCSCL